MQAKKAVAFTEDIDPKRGYIHCVCNWSPNIAWGGTGKLYLILDILEFIIVDIQKILYNRF